MCSLAGLWIAGKKEGRQQHSTSDWWPGAWMDRKVSHERIRSPHVARADVDETAFPHLSVLLRCHFPKILWLKINDREIYMLTLCGIQVAYIVLSKVLAIR